MGVPAFYRWLSERYPKTVVDVIEELPEVRDGEEVPVDTSRPNPNGTEYDNLYLDMNGIIHPASHPEDRPPPETEDDMYLAIFDYLDRVFACVRPRRLLYMAIDGVAPRAKMNQQRSRRFRSAQEAQEIEDETQRLRDEWSKEGRALPAPQKKAFDSNVITPGTPFMARLAEYLRYFVHRKMTFDPGWKNIQVILSDASSPGEGEHKIMEYIRLQRTQPDYDPNTRHALHGLDADLIMLALATHEPHFTILREMVTFGKTDKCAVCGQLGHTADQCKGEAKKDSGEFNELAPKAPPVKPFQFLRISVLREYLEKEFSQAADWSQCIDGFELEKVLDDFVFMCFLVGNDFLPHLPSLDIREGAIDTLIDLYKKLVPTMDGMLSTNGVVNIARVERFLKELGNIEDEVLRRRRMKEEKMEDRRKRRDDDVKSGKCGKQHAQMIQSFAAPADGYSSRRAQADGVQRFHPDMARPDHRASHRDASLLKLFNDIKAFNEDDPENPKEQVLDLLSSINGFERAMAHQYCDELCLVHKTVGEGDDRHIRITRTHSALENANAADVFNDKIKQTLRGKGDEIAAAQEDSVMIGTDGWKTRYYSQKLGANEPSQVSEIVRKYLQGLCWVMAYYYKGCQSWSWYYPYHYAPAASDLVGLEAMDVSYEMAKPFSAIRAAHGCIPSTHRHLAWSSPSMLPHSAC